MHQETTNKFSLEVRQRADGSGLRGDPDDVAQAILIAPTALDALPQFKVCFHVTQNESQATLFYGAISY